MNYQERSANLEATLVNLTRDLLNRVERDYLVDIDVWAHDLDRVLITLSIGDKISSKVWIKHGEAYPGWGCFANGGPVSMAHADAQAQLNLRAVELAREIQAQGLAN